jgi:hypothetical protein
MARLSLSRSAMRRATIWSVGIDSDSDRALTLAVLTPEVSVEIVVSGKVLAKKNLVVDGKVNDVRLDLPLGERSRIAN